jgi:oligopeptide/dipeptide ABC transporter ATP-binding protein
MSAPLASLRGLTVHFPGRGGGVQAVRGVDLDLAAGQVTTLIGESGSGKSTVLLALAGLLPGRARIGGSLTLAGHSGDVLPPGPARAGIAGREIGVVFQNPGASLNPVLTVGDQVDEVVRVHRGLSAAAARAETLALFARCGIGDAEARAAAYPHQLSGGLKQRVAIAAALAGGPRLILADEPTTALDATVQAQILDLMLDLVDREGVGLLIVTHDMGVAGSIADRLAVMYAGRIVETGPAAAVVGRPAHPYSAALAAAALPPGAASTRSDQPFPALPPAAGPVPPGGCAFAPRCAVATDRCRAEDPALAPVGAAMVACFHPQAGPA